MIKNNSFQKCPIDSLRSPNLNVFDQHSDVTNISKPLTKLGIKSFLLKVPYGERNT